jgi:hypothetical protein
MVPERACDTGKGKGDWDMGSDANVNSKRSDGIAAREEALIFITRVPARRCQTADAAGYKEEDALFSLDGGSVGASCAAARAPQPAPRPWVRRCHKGGRHLISIVVGCISTFSVSPKNTAGGTDASAHAQQLCKHFFAPFY